MVVFRFALALFGIAALVAFLAARNKQGYIK